MLPDITHILLVQHGYKLTDDAWISKGRRTYHHNDDATRDFITRLARVLRTSGWETHPEILRAFHHSGSGEIIEIEPGGEETTGHHLHLLK
jgi:hypothetical protein